MWENCFVYKKSFCIFFPQIFINFLDIEDNIAVARKFLVLLFFIFLLISMIYQHAVSEILNF